MPMRAKATAPSFNMQLLFVAAWIMLPVVPRHPPSPVPTEFSALSHTFSNKGLQPSRVDKAVACELNGTCRLNGTCASIKWHTSVD